MNIRRAKPSDKDLVLDFCANTFEWGDFPRLNDEPAAAGHGGQRKYKKRRRRGGRGRGGGRPEGTSDENAMKDPNVMLDSDGKTSWGDWLKRFTGLK